jgi:hypothetical protein
MESLVRITGRTMVDCTIAITAMPPDRTIKGTEMITYINNSPDTLGNSSFKLFLNIHKPGAPREFGASPDYLTSGVHIDEMQSQWTNGTGKI